MGVALFINNVAPGLRDLSFIFARKICIAGKRTRGRLVGRVDKYIWNNPNVFETRVSPRGETRVGEYCFFSKYTRILSILFLFKICSRILSVHRRYLLLCSIVDHISSTHAYPCVPIYIAIYMSSNFSREGIRRRILPWTRIDEETRSRPISRTPLAQSEIRFLAVSRAIKSTVPQIIAEARPKEIQVDRVHPTNRRISRLRHLKLRYRDHRGSIEPRTMKTRIERTNDTNEKSNRNANTIRFAIESRLAGFV